MNDLVERLRRPRGPITGQWPGPSAIELEAATAIETLTRERDEARAEVERLKAALETARDRALDEAAAAVTAGYQGLCAEHKLMITARATAICLLKAATKEAP